MDEIDSSTLRRARKLRSSAVARVVNESYPAVTRIALGLTGSQQVGVRIANQLVRRGMIQMPKFREPGEPHRWFLHHTVLACRAEPGSPIQADSDLLYTAAGAGSAPYLAFIRALRHLPAQQAEAFILHRGESFNLRYLAVAMDCSTAAAQMHLETGTAALRAIAGDEFDALCATLRSAYQSLTPSDRVAAPSLRSIVRRHVWPRRILAMLRLLAWIGVGLLVAWFCFRILPRIDY